MPIGFIAVPDLAPRGVHLAHCLSEFGGLILFVVDRKHRLLPRTMGSVREVGPHERPEEVHEQLMQLLERLDPEPGQTESDTGLIAG